MNQEPRPPLDTKEFVAGWQSIVEEHVVNDLAAALGKIASAGPGGADLTPEQCAALARQLTHALVVAAGPGGSVQAAVHYLCEVAGHPEQPGPS